MAYLPTGSLVALMGLLFICAGFKLHKVNLCSFKHEKGGTFGNYAPSAMVI